MRNITLTVSEDVAKWARIYAAEHDISLSRLMSDLLKEKMVTEVSYQKAMETFLTKKPQTLKKIGSYPERESLYER